MSDPQDTTPNPSTTIPAEEDENSEVKVFLSHKTVDRTLALEFKMALVALGLKKGDIFLSEEISPGLPWHNRIFSALRSCQTLFFLYTDPSLDWDWCLFECGFFAGLSDVNGPPRRLICINAGIGRPSPLDQWQDVSSPETLREVLTGVATETKSDLPSQSEFSTFVTSLWNSFTHHIPQKADPRYQALQQRRMSVTVSPDAMEEITSGKPIGQGVKIEISDGAREIFVNAPLESQWSDFIATLAPWQTDWAEAIAVTIRMLNGTRTASPMLPLVKSNTQAPVLFRPSIVQRDLFSAGSADPLDTSTRYTIIFIRTPDATMAGQNREDRLYHWLMLGRNFREAIIEGYSKKMAATTLKHEGVRQLTQDLLDEIALTRIDSASRGLNIDEDLKLFCSESARAIRSLAERWNNIERSLKDYKALARGLDDDPPEDQVQALITNIKDALQAIREVNEAFTLHATCALMSSVASAA